MWPERILLIDDEDDIREVAAVALDMTAGMAVTGCSGGVEGVAAAAADRPDLILLDVMMPGLDGPSTLQRLRNCAATRDIPVIFLTACVQPADRKRLTSLGAIGVIAKPFDPFTLADEISAIAASTR